MECLATIGCTVFGTIYDYAIGQAGNQLQYLLSYKDNIENLKKQSQRLDGIINRIQSHTERAKNEGDAIVGHVQDWQKDATAKSEGAKCFLEPDPDHTRARCSCRWPLPNLALRRRLSKKAKEMAEEIARVIEMANNFGNDISFRPAVQLSFEQKDFEKFETRKATLSRMMEALRNPEVRIIGLSGIGGIGKTMLAKEVARLAKEGNLFRKQIMAVVSQNSNIERIQQEIADQLGLKFEKEVLSTRAERLGERLKQEEKILIVLDDVWKELDLFEVGIRFNDDNKECKIIVTSRSQEVCKAMGADENTTFQIKSLTEEEAANLFNKIVGDVKPEFESLATEVIGECGGLPLAIVTIASALKINKSLSFWRNALLELKRSPTESEIYGKIYTCFKTSFDALGNEAKSLLLICGAHKEDENVSLQELTGYVMVLDLFGYVYNTLQEASDKVESLVNNLKAYSLLSDGDYPGTVKVHDIIRDVAISIASKLQKNPMYCLRESVRLEDCMNRDNFKDLYAISIPGGGGGINDQLPERLASPKLKLLMLRNRVGLEIPDKFFEETKELKALRLDFIGGKQLASSFRSLQNLKALHLRISNGRDVDIAIIGELKNLLILDLSDSDGLVVLPKEIGNLSRLQVLNLNGCRRLEVIKPNVISSLVKLEELYMEDVYYVERETEGLSRSAGEQSNASLGEIKHLPQLRVLHLHTQDGSVVPEDMFNHLNLERYRILIGEFFYSPYKSRTRVLRVNQLKDTSRLLYKDGFQRLMKKSDDLCLKNIPGVKHLINELDASSFQNLECLVLHELENLKSIASIPTRSNIEEEIERPRPLFNTKAMFINLQELTIYKGNSLFSVWALATFESLQQLKYLSIGECDLIKEVLIVTEEAGDAEQRESKKISFPKLECLQLQNLPKLKRFCQSDDHFTIEFPSLLQLSIDDCPELRTFIAKSTPSTSTTVEEVEERRMAQEILFNSKAMFINLQELTIYKCNSLFSVWALATFESLQQLENLSIGECDLIEELLIVTEEVGDAGERESKKISFPKLESLVLKKLPKLKRFCQSDDHFTIEFSSLLQLSIDDCPELRTFIAKSTPSISTTVKEVEERRMAPEILFNSKVMFINLQELTFYECNSLFSVWALATFQSLQQLKELRINNCDLIEEVLIVTKEAGDAEKRELKKISFPKLEYLELLGLPKLKRFCQSDDHFTIEFPSLLQLYIDCCPELRTFIAKSTPSISTTVEEVEERRIAQEILFNSKVMFINLQELTIDECNSLFSVWALATFQSLQQLKELRIKNCDLIEEVLIVTEEAGDAEKRESKKISFPKLECLQLQNLPKLKRFCQSDDHFTIEFPSLLQLSIDDCPELRTFIAKSTHSTSTTVEEVEERRMAQEILFNSKVAGMSFRNLQGLVIFGCNNVQYLLSFVMAENLTQLKKLIVSECKAMEQIVTKAVGEYQGRLKKIAFPRLQSLVLNYLPKLKRFCEGDCIECPSLLELYIQGCFEFQTFIPNSHESTVPTLQTVDEERDLVAQQPLFNEKVVLTNLTDLVVGECHGLINLFNSSTATSLARLTRVVISKCYQMTQVIHVNGHMEDEIAAESEIVFSQLTILALHRLPSLKCFHSGNRELRFPNLKKIIVSECPEMSSFSRGIINTPNLNRLIMAKLDVLPWYFSMGFIFKTLEEAKSIVELWEGDLNRSMRKIWDDSHI